MIKNIHRILKIVVAGTALSAVLGTKPALAIFISFAATDDSFGVLTGSFDGTPDNSGIITLNSVSNFTWSITGGSLVGPLTVFGIPSTDPGSGESTFITYNSNTNSLSLFAASPQYIQPGPEPGAFVARLRITNNQLGTNDPQLPSLDGPAQPPFPAGSGYSIYVRPLVTVTSPFTPVRGEFTDSFVGFANPDLPYPFLLSGSFSYYPRAINNGQVSFSNLIFSPLNISTQLPDINPTGWEFDLRPDPTRFNGTPCARNGGCDFYFDVTTRMFVGNFQLRRIYAYTPSGLPAYESTNCFDNVCQWSDKQAVTIINGQSVPEPNTVAGILLTGVAAWQMRKKRFRAFSSAKKIGANCNSQQ